MKPRPSFAVLLRSLRGRAGLTQDQLARVAGVSQGQLSLLESGRRRPGWDAVQRLAAALRVSTEALRDVPLP